MSGAKCIHDLIDQRLQEDPESVAAVFNDESVTCRVLRERANRLANHLVTLGVGPEVRVAILVDRSIEMLVSVLATLKAGGAFVPLDPSFPPARLTTIIDDAQPAVILTDDDYCDMLPDTISTIVNLSCHGFESESIAAPCTGVEPRNLAYVMYVSESPESPVGVMVNHRNVWHAFSGLDEHIPHDPPGVWLAVTGLSFDISVLELLWTLGRGFTVVIAPDQAMRTGTLSTGVQARPMHFSLFFFASDEGGERSGDKYELITEATRFGDKNDFVAVWAPERHFHAFGGLSPNPSVMCAALATITSRIQLRSGSVVLPLHHPVRVVEEWSLVDNLSRGRVGLGVAAGWFPNDFVLAPQSYDDRKKIFAESIETIRKLWRGERLSVRNPMGDLVELQTMPRPVQKDVPLWVTAAINPDTFRQAGEIGANVLTHLLGQSIEELAGKIQVYRKAWNEAGHPGTGQVALMLHTFVGADDETVHQLVREPMKKYLGSSVNLVSDYVTSLPVFKESVKVDVSGLTADDVDHALEFSFERYFQTSGLFGSPARCLAFIDKIKKIGVDEAACLIDFGVDTKQVLDSLNGLNRVRRLANRHSSARPDHGSIGEQMKRLGVTHLQCTPSLARMIGASEEGREALNDLDVLLIGGEGSDSTAAREFKAWTDAKVLAVYGQAETTIWSAVDLLDDDTGDGTIGQPIADSRFLVVDGELNRVSPGVTGDLLVGGDGVARGYLNRDDLAGERFFPPSPSQEPGGRLFRTGELARYLPDGKIEIIGRSDRQINIRGYRMDLGEIESSLCAIPCVRSAFVTAAGDTAADRRLAAYLISDSGVEMDVEQLRSAIRKTLPEYMVPTFYVWVPSFPRTRQGAVDVTALPQPESARREPVGPRESPQNDVEETIMGIWRELLGTENIGAADTFFDLGGHSLLMVSMHHKLEQAFDRNFAIVDLFQFPSVRSLAKFITGQGNRDELARDQRRGRSRREALAKRRRSRQERKDVR